MNQAEVVLANWTNRDPPNMSLRDVCMVDIIDTEVIETELEGIKNRKCQAGTRRQHGRVVRAPDLKSGGRWFKSCSDHLAGVVSRWTLVQLLGHTTTTTRFI